MTHAFLPRDGGRNELIIAVERIECLHFLHRRWVKVFASRNQAIFFFGELQILGVYSMLERGGRIILAEGIHDFVTATAKMFEVDTRNFHWLVIRQREQVHCILEFEIGFSEEILWVGV